MKSFDLVIIGILAIFAAIGAWRGLLRELISMLTWVLAVIPSALSPSVHLPGAPFLLAALLLLLAMASAWRATVR